MLGSRFKLVQPTTPTAVASNLTDNTPGSYAKEQELGRNFAADIEAEIDTVSEGQILERHTVLVVSITYNYINAFNLVFLH